MGIKGQWTNKRGVEEANFDVEALPESVDWR